VRHILILLSILLLSFPLFGQSTKKVDLSLLAKELMLWMQANCEVPGVHPEHNFCNLNWNHPVPEITILPRKQLVKEFRKNGGNIPGRPVSAVKGFYVNRGRERFKIYMLDQNYSKVLPQADLLHEVSHYIQDKNGLLTDCPPNYEIPTYLMQIQYYKAKTGNGATAKMIKEYKRHFCNTLY
ncbi:uncharacterized protein METZ01_LOCUS447331, partial [marine metagenome]